MAALQKTRPLSIESFSYSWLMNLNPSLDQSLEGEFKRDSIDAYDEASFIEMDPKLSPSKRFSRVVPNKYLNFDFPTSQSPSIEIHADKFIYNGYLLPLFVKPLKMEPYGNSEFAPAAPIPSVKHNEVHVFSRLRCASVRRCQRLSKQILEKYFDFVRPLCQKMRWDRCGSRPGNTMKKAKVHRDKVKHWQYSPANSVDNFRRSCDSESSIHEAVLHCKRSIGK